MNINECRGLSYVWWLYTIFSYILQCYLYTATSYSFKLLQSYFLALARHTAFPNEMIWNGLRYTWQLPPCMDLASSIFQVILLMAEIRRSPVEIGSWHPIIYRVLYIPGGAGFFSINSMYMAIYNIGRCTTKVLAADLVEMIAFLKDTQLGEKYKKK